MFADKLQTCPTLMTDRKKTSLWPWLAAPVSGLLLTLCFPGWNLSGFVWVWMLPLLPAIWRGEKKRYGFALGYLAGFAFWLVNMKWLWTVSGIGAVAMAAFLATYFGIWGAISVSLGNPWKSRNRKGKIDAESQGQNNIQKAINRKLAGKKNSGLLGGALTDSLLSLKFAMINAAAWVAVEWLRSVLFTGFAWNGLGVAFHQTPVLAQASDLIGVTGLAFVPVFFSAVVVQTGRRLMREAREGKLKPRMDFGVAALLLAVQFCYGVWRLKDIQGWEMDRVRVLLVQENIAQTLNWDPGQSMAIAQDHADSTINAIEALERDADAQLRGNVDEAFEIKTPDLVIWPESAVLDPLLYVEEVDQFMVYEGVRHILNEEVRPLGNFTLISGMNEMEADLEGDRVMPRLEGKMFNSLVTVAPRGMLETNIKTYHKVHLVLFGEYIPFLNELPFLKNLFEFSSGASYVGNFQPGNLTEPMVVQLPDGEMQLIPSVCFEDTVGRLTRKFVRPAPQMIVNVTNDGWFKESEAADQHWANARFRAIELRRPMVRSANTGVSGIISVSGSVNDPVTGKRQVIEDESGSHFTRDHLYGHVYVPKSGPMTLYALAGDWFAWLMGAWVIAMAIRERLLTS